MQIRSSNRAEIIIDRAKSCGEYIVRNKATIREAARNMNVSKSTVHKDIERLLYIDLNLYFMVREIIGVNKSERHIRGGMATKMKWEFYRKK